MGNKRKAVNCNTKTVSQRYHHLMNTPLKKTLKNLIHTWSHVKCGPLQHANKQPYPSLSFHNTHVCVTNQNSVSLFTFLRPLARFSFFATSGVCRLLPPVCDSTTQRPPSPKNRPIDDSKPKPGTQNTPRCPRYTRSHHIHIHIT